MGSLATAASITAGQRDGTGIVFWVSFGAAMMFQPLWFLAGFCTLLAIHGLQARIVRNRASERGYITHVDMITDSFGPMTAKSMAAVMVIMSLFFAAAQLFVSGKILSLVLHIPMAGGLVLSAVTVGIYLLLGGYKTLMRTDVLQWLILFTVAILALFTLDYPDMQKGFENFAVVPFNEKAGWFLMGMTYMYSAPDVWQRGFSANSSKAARNGYFLAIPIFCIFSFALMLGGMNLMGMNPQAFEGDLFEEIFITQPLHPLLLAVISVVFASSVMSTLDSLLYNFGSITVKNLFKTDPGESREKYIKQVRIITVAVLVVLSGAALFINDIINYLIDSTMIIAVAAPFFVMAVFFEKQAGMINDRVAAGIIVLGTALYLALFFTGNLQSLLSNNWACGLATILLAIAWVVSYAREKRNTQVVDNAA
jgi:SSS family solute:Na+ symporter